MTTNGAPPGLGFTPADCERLTVHQPGLIQPHGALLALRWADLTVAQASDNVDRWLGMTADALLGRPVADAIGDEAAERLRAAVAREGLDGGPRFALALPGRGHLPAADVTAHVADGVLVLELEPAARGDFDGRTDPYALVRDAVARLQASATLAGFCQTVADEVRRLTGFDRVMVYRLAPDRTGEVIAEARRADVPTFLGKRFPAGDLPQPARDLLAKNWVHLVPDVGAAAVAVVPTVNPDTGRPLDMSRCQLRQSHRFCTDYLTNLGVAAQLTMPVVRDGQLWGTISGHHHGPRPLPLPVRSACEVIAQVASLQVAGAEDREAGEERARLSAAREAILAALDHADDPAAWLVANAAAVAGLLPADGLAVCDGDRVTTHGVTPPAAAIRAVVAWLDARHADDVFATDSLPADVPVDGIADTAGLLAVGFGSAVPAWLVWFRREQVRSVTWAGDPRKPVLTGPLGEYLSPRRSFDRWAEAVRGRSAPWRPAEVAAAAKLRDGVLDRVRTRDARADRLRAEMAAATRELDSFVYVASHDLKEPVRGILRYAHLLTEQAGKQLDPAGRQRLDGLVRLTDRMGSLVESLLHFSRVGRLDLTVAEADLSAVAAEAVDVAGPRIADAGAAVTVGPLPTVRCDRGWVREVLVNLITNAIKYNDKAVPTVEIGTVPDGADDGTGPPAVFVRDNGIGIPDRHRAAVFQMFKRLHGRDEFGGGTGAGLAVVRRIVERHGGRIWVESTPGQGSTFAFTLAPAAAQAEAQTGRFA